MGSNNTLSSAQQTALTILLASQQNGGSGGGPGGNGGCGGGQSPKSLAAANTARQNQQLLSVLQAVSKGGGDPFLHGGIQGGIQQQRPLGYVTNNLSSLLGLAASAGGGNEMMNVATGAQ